jgi:hypothetical protein
VVLDQESSVRAEDSERLTEKDCRSVRMMKHVANGHDVESVIRKGQPVTVVFHDSDRGPRPNMCIDADQLTYAELVADPLCEETIARPEVQHRCANGMPRQGGQDVAENPDAFRVDRPLVPTGEKLLSRVLSHVIRGLPSTDPNSPSRSRLYHWLSLRRQS